MATVRLILMRLGLALALIGPVQGQAQEGGAAAVQEMIQGQFDAFLADDFGAAFEFAAPGIRNVFRTPENFGMMVRNGYPMVWRPGSVKFLELHQRDGRPWQKVMITDAEGAVHVLDYEIVSTPEGLRIGAVELLFLPDVGA